MFTLIQMAEQAALDEKADQRHDQRRHDQGDKESGGTLTENGGDRVGHEGADHIERTVGDIGDAQHSQDQAEA